MRISVLPKSHLGWWSVGLCVAIFLFFGVGQLTLGPGPDYNVVLDHTITIVITSIAVAALVTGAVSIVKRKQGAILVFVSTAIGLICVMGGTVEMLSWAK